MTGARKYDDGCAAGHALDLVGERWALLVARELLFGPKRFTDLRAGLPGASSNVLSQRLRELERAGIISRRKLARPAAAWVYELTEWGQELERVILDLGRWGARSPAMRHDAPISVDALFLALKSLFEPSRADPVAKSLMLRLGEDVFRLGLSRDGITIRRGELDDPHALVTTDAVTLNALLWGDRQLADATAAGEVTIIGDHALVERFLTMFPLPEPAK